MTISPWFFVAMLLTGPAGLADDDRPLAERFASIKARFEAREKAFHAEYDVVYSLKGDGDRLSKLVDMEDAFLGGQYALMAENRDLILAYPADPATLEGIIVFCGTMRMSLEDDLDKIVRDRFLDDPRMGRLCDAMACLTADVSKSLLKDVAAKHPDRAVRGQAVYALGMNWLYSSGKVFTSRERTEAEKSACLEEASRCFDRVVDEFADVPSADGKSRIADKAKAELVRIADKATAKLERIANLPNLEVGKIAPEIAGKDLDGEPLKLSDHRGRVVVVCFWATWCRPCMGMVPHDRELFERMKGKPFALLGVNSDAPEDREKVRQTAKDKGMSWPSWWDDGAMGPIQIAYNVRQWPTVYVLDPKGVIRFINVHGEALDRAVDSLLAEMAAGAGLD